MEHESSQSQPQKGDSELIRATLDIARCHLIGVLILWLALFAPVTCQYHGLMIHFGGETNQSDHANHADSSGPESRLQSHEMASQATVVMSLFVAVTPDDLLLLAPATARQVQPHDPRQPAQLALPVPDQPPRQF
jgi:hypothetical protein